MEVVGKKKMLVIAVPEYSAFPLNLISLRFYHFSFFIRIIGGIGILAPWWPIKAYRPCPKFINSGGLYERAGQGLEEIAFGRED